MESRTSPLTSTIKMSREYGELCSKEHSLLVCCDSDPISPSISTLSIVSSTSPLSTSSIWSETKLSVDESSTPVPCNTLALNSTTLNRLSTSSNSGSSSAGPRSTDRLRLRTPRAGRPRTRNSSDNNTPLVAESVSKQTRKVSSESRSTIALSVVKSRMATSVNGRESMYRSKSPTLATRKKLSSVRTHQTHTNTQPPATAPVLPVTPTPSLTRRRGSFGSASSQSTTSSSSSTPSLSIRSRPTLQRARSSMSALPTPPTPAKTVSSSIPSSISTSKTIRPSGILPPRTTIMKKLMLASNDVNKDIIVDTQLVEDLKAQYIAAEESIQQLIAPSPPTSKNSVLRPDLEVKRLTRSIKNLSEHSGALLIACEALQRQQSNKEEEIKEMQMLNRELVRERTIQMDETASTPPPSPSKDSPMSGLMREMLARATEQIEIKWKARFAEQLAEHEQALAKERERASESVLEHARIVTESKHEQEDATKALKDEHAALINLKKLMEIENLSLGKEVESLKAQLKEQDEMRLTSASFWQKTTDLAKQNRTLTEELALSQQQVTKHEERIKILQLKVVELRKEINEFIPRTKELETQKQVAFDRCLALESKFEAEKGRREQFQVHVEQLTVENTALYAQMVALQTTHEAKMEELRSQYEKRQVVLGGEMRALQSQNVLLREKSSSNLITSSSVENSSLPVDTDREWTERLTQTTDELLIAQQELVARADQIAELERRIAEGEQIRRKMHNTIQELRGNIRVHVRVRPFLRSDHEELSDGVPCIQCDALDSTITTTHQKTQGDLKSHTFSFDKIYGQAETQETVFSDVSDFIQSAIDGYHVCIFAYGQTGSGKTHTMQGSGKAQMRGIIPRSISLILESCVAQQQDGWNYTLAVTFYEIYNESIRDLLVTSTETSQQQEKLTIRMDKQGKTFVEGLLTITINFDIAEEQVESIMNMAACNRSVDKTDMNAHSSRSHSIFGLTIRGVNEAQNTEVEGSLSLVDLAGSERLSRSNATGDRLKEAQAINKSLSALADVFQALAKKSPHVPYRNSRLTHILQPALSGDGKTLMMVNLSPTSSSLDESLCSLRFAQNVSQCELGAPTRQIKNRSAIANSVNNAPQSTQSRGTSLLKTTQASTPTTSRLRRSMSNMDAASVRKRLFCE